MNFIINHYIVQCQFLCFKLICGIIFYSSYLNMYFVLS